MLRRRLKTTDLRIEEYKIGQRTGTGIALVYLKGLVSEQVLTEIRRRLNAINTDAILESKYIEEFIQDGGLTPFPTILLSAADPLWSVLRLYAAEGTL